MDALSLIVVLLQRQRHCEMLIVSQSLIVLSALPLGNSNAQSRSSGLNTLLDLSDCGDGSAINDVFASCDRRRTVGNQERHQLCDFLGPVRASEWNPAK